MIRLILFVLLFFSINQLYSQYDSVYTLAKDTEQAAYLSIKITVNNTHELITNYNLVINNTSKNLFDTIHIYNQNIFNCYLDTENSYKIYVYKDSISNKFIYLPNESYIYLKNREIRNLNIPLNRIDLIEEYRIEKIYYEFNKTTINEKGHLIIDTLAKAMLTYPKMKIAINSASSCNESNSRLISIKRSNKVLYNFKKLGILKNRIIINNKGYYYSLFGCLCIRKKSNCKEKYLEQDRRTEFKIVSF